MSVFDRLVRAAESSILPRDARGALMSDAPPQQEIMLLDGDATSDFMPPSPIHVTQPRLDPNFVTRLVAQTDAQPQRTRSGGDKQGYMHLSSLIGACGRENTISFQHGRPTYQTVSGGMKIIWKIGRAVERHIRNSVIVARDWQGFWGVWKCRCRASEHTGLHPRDRTCPRCGSGLNTYFEPLLISEEYGVIGSPDMTMIEMGYFFPSEIKSMNKEQFDALEGPLADHCLQACGYRKLYQLMGYPVLDIVPVVYGRKDFKFGGTRAVYKEYHVDYRDWEGQIMAMFEMGRDIRRANLAGQLLDRVCDTIECRRAKTCERASLCFSL